MTQLGCLAELAGRAGRAGWAGYARWLAGLGWTCWIGLDGWTGRACCTGRLDGLAGWAGWAGWAGGACWIAGCDWLSWARTMYSKNIKYSITITIMLLYCGKPKWVREVYFYLHQASNSTKLRISYWTYYDFKARASGNTMHITSFQSWPLSKAPGNSTK